MPAARGDSGGAEDSFGGSFLSEGSGLSPFADATTPVYRLFTNVNGIYRLTGAYLGAQAPGLAGTATGALKLMNKGVEVPIRVVDDGDGVLEPADFIEFYGEGLLGEPPLILNFDFGQPFPPIMQANDFTDENVYFLFGELGPRSRIPDVSGTVIAGPPLATTFQEKIRREVNDIFLPDGANDPFYSKPFSLNSPGGSAVADPNGVNCGWTAPAAVQTMTGFLGPDPNSGTGTFCPACNLALPDVVTGAATATLRVRMRGISAEGANPDHLAVIQVGTSSAPFAARCWDGEGTVEQTVSVTHTLLAGGAGVFIGQPGLQSTGGSEGLVVDWVEAEYNRHLRLSGGAVRAGFTNVDRTYDIAGYATGTAADRLLYDISRSVAGSSVPSPRRVTGGNTSGSGPFTRRVTLTADGALPPGAPRLLVAAEPAGFKLPLRVEEVEGEDLTLTTHAADMIVVTHPAAADLSPGSDFMSYLDHRAADSGLSVKVVLIRDVYDSFSFGLETPEALRSFLAYAYDNWRGFSGTEAAPAYVLLVGDATVDYKNNEGRATWVNQVPTFSMFQPNPFFDVWTSDTYVSAFRGADQLPDIHLGRIATRDIQATEDVFLKMLDYDMMPPEPWHARALMLADRGQSPGEGASFRSTQDALASTWFGPPFTSGSVYHDPNGVEGPADPNAWRTEYSAEANAGVAFTSYLGHGNFQNWGFQTLLNSSDPNHMNLLLPTGRPSFVINQNCLVGGFGNHAGEALAEVLQEAPSKGAIAMFAPAGLSFASVVVPKINDSIYPSMFGLMKERRFGVLSTDAKIALATSLGDLQAYSLLGDPAQRLALPAPRPPVGLDAVSGLNGRVDLTWGPSPDAGAPTRIYRATAPAGPYSLLNPSGAPGTAYSDMTAISGINYFYRAVSVDLSGPFEGPISNLNSTCDVSDPNDVVEGPDCVHARPVNPNPPSAPAGFHLINPGTGTSLEAAWSPAEPDISHYTLSYGTAPPAYDETIIVPAGSTGAELTGLTSGVIYHAILTATNYSGLTGPASPDRTGTPSSYDGINPPTLVIDLDIRRSVPFPDSTHLTWTGPSLDIYGGTTTLDSLAIYRGTNPYFIPDPSNRIAVIDDPSAGSYTDPGAWAAPQNFFYIITATDTRGFTSGAGRQLPKGIPDLAVTRAGGNLNFAWSPVTQDVDGQPTFVDHYVLYADTQPVGRTRIGSLTPLRPFIATSGVSVPVPPQSVTFYSVIVVDVRGNLSPF